MVVSFGGGGAGADRWDGSSGCRRGGSVAWLRSMSRASVVVLCVAALMACTTVGASPLVPLRTPAAAPVSLLSISESELEPVGGDDILADREPVFRVKRPEQRAVLPSSTVKRCGSPDAGQYCPFPRGQCCPDGRSCCEFACGAQNECKPSPLSVAMRIAKRKVEAEAEEDRQTAAATAAAQQAEQDAKQKKEEEARAEETAKDNAKTNEFDTKRKEVEDARKEALAKTAAEAKAAADAKKKAEAEARRLELLERERLEMLRIKAEEETAKQRDVVLKGPARPKRNHIIATDDQLNVTSGYTIMFWINVDGIKHSWTSVLHKGSVNNERSPAIFLFPDSSQLSVRSSTSKNIKASFNPSGQLPLHNWTHVAVTHKEGDLNIYYNGRSVLRSPAAAPALNDGPLFASDPWYEPAVAMLADVRFLPTAVGTDKVVEAFNLKRFASLQVRQVELAQETYVPHRKNMRAPASQIERAVATTYMLWVKPTGLVQGLSALFMKGANARSVSPGLFFANYSTKLVYRFQSQKGLKSVTLSSAPLPMNEWTHVAIAHREGEITVFYDAKMVHREAAPHPVANLDPLYDASGVSPARVKLADVRYMNAFATTRQIEVVARLKQYEDAPQPILKLSTKRFDPNKQLLKDAADLPSDVPQYSYAFWVRPLETTGEPGGLGGALLHKGSTSAERGPAVFFNTYSTELVVFVDDKTQVAVKSRPLPLLRWTHVAITHMDNELVIYFNAREVKRASLPVHTNSGPLYSGSPWSLSAKAKLSDLRYMNGVMSPKQIEGIVKERKI